MTLRSTDLPVITASHAEPNKGRQMLPKPPLMRSAGSIFPLLSPVQGGRMRLRRFLILSAASPGETQCPRVSRRSQPTKINTFNRKEKKKHQLSLYDQTAVVHFPLLEKAPLIAAAPLSARRVYQPLSSSESCRSIKQLAPAVSPDSQWGRFIGDGSRLAGWLLGDVSIIVSIGLTVHLLAIVWNCNWLQRFVTSNKVLSFGKNFLHFTVPQTNFLHLHIVLHLALCLQAPAKLLHFKQYLISYVFTRP